MSFAVTISSYRNNAAFSEKIAVVFRVVNTCNRLRLFSRLSALIWLFM